MFPILSFSSHQGDPGEDMRPLHGRRSAQQSNSLPVQIALIVITLIVIGILSLGDQGSVPIMMRILPKSAASSVWAAPAEEGVDLVAMDLEVTQVVQDLDNSVRLVQDKRTFVRFFARVDGDEQAAQATLLAQRDGQSVTLAPLNAGRVVLNSEPDRGVLDQAFLFELPDGFRQGTVTLIAQVSADANDGVDPNGSNNSVSVTVDFEPVPPLNLVLYRLGYHLDGVDYWASSADRDQLVDWLGRTYPVSDLHVWDRTLWLGDAQVDENGKLTHPTCGEVNTILASKKLWDTAYGVSGVPVDAHYYGMVDDGGGFLSGCALGSPYFVASGATGSSSWGWDTDGTFGDWYGAFELAITYGQEYAGFCGAPSNPDYPHASGRISPDLSGRGALYGFDSASHTLYAPGYKDLMTRCGYLWMSDHTYEGLLDWFQANSTASVSSDLSARTQLDPQDRLLIAGTINPANMAVDLNPFFVIPNVGDLVPRTPGPFAIVLRNEAGAELARYPFTPSPAEDGGVAGMLDPNGQPGDSPLVPLAFTELVPYVPGTAAVEIRVPDSAFVSGVTARPGLPQVQILSPVGGEQIVGPKVSVNWTGVDEDGDSLVYNVQYSADGGQSWEVVAQGIHGTSVEIDTANLAAGQDARFRVWASDGIHTTFVDSASLSLANRAPQLRLLTPGAISVAAHQTVNLAASGYDLDTGPLAGGSMRWSSNLDGDLGTGTSLSLADLSVGNHTISVSAEDAQGASDVQVIPLTVVGTPDELPPANNALQASPSMLSLKMQGEGTAYIFVANAKIGESVNWTAHPNDDWIVLGKTSGDTPGIIPVSVNWTSVNWTSVNWTSVNWTSVNWTSVNWTSVNWTSVNWTSVNWTGSAPEGELLGSITLTSDDLSTSIVIPVEAVVEPYPVFLPAVDAD